MKKALTLLFPVLSFAAVTNVRVLGTTPTQAVIAYTAPGSGACTIAVSLSASYTPLVPDVNPTLFTGANSDNRSGSITVGRSRVFVVGTRTVQAAGGTNYSRALQAMTLYYFQITCGADTATGTFTTLTIPGGVGYGDPIPIDPANNGNYLYPTFSTTDRTSSAIDPHTGALVKNMTLPGDLTGGIAAGMSSSGVGVLCSPIPVKASDENKYGYHCEVDISSGGGSPGLYWIAPDGETRFLGVMRTSYGPTVEGACMGSLSASFDAVDPNTFYCTVRTNDYADQVIAKGVYAGHAVRGNDVDLTNQNPTPPGGTPHTTFTQIVPDPRALYTLLKEFDAKYSTYGATCCGNYISGNWANGKLLFYSWGASQDTFGWVAEYDLNRTPAQQTTQFGNSNGCIDNPPVTGSSYAGQTGCIVASTGTFTGGQGSGFRWSTLHTLDDTPASSWIPIVLNILAQKTSLDYQVTLTSALSITPGTCTEAQPGGNTLPSWPDTSWTNGCSTFTVSGDPALVGTAPTYPSTLPALPGDLLTVSSADYIHHEILRLLDKGTDGRTWYVQRKWYYNVSGDCLYPYSSVGIGGTLGMLTPLVLANCNTTGTLGWWNPVAGALSTDNTSVLGDAMYLAHPTFINNALYGRWTYNKGVAEVGTEPGRLLSPPTQISMGEPGFNGINQAAIESHPSLSISNPPDRGTYQQVVDARPYFGDTTLATTSSVSLVSGQLYRIRGTNVAGNYKLIPYFANSGSRAMKEVSGPAALLATDSSRGFQWCVALKAGECYSGSLANDIYFNAPGIVNAYCTYNWSTLQTTMRIPNDICVSPSSVVTQAIQMQEIANDPFGLQLRVISNSLSKYEQESNFWNSRTIPDGSWLFTPLAAVPGSLKLIKIPPRQTDSVNRTAYVPISVSLPAVPGVSNAIIEFGYGENGNPGSFYCTARQEACVAQSGTINASQPFYFASTEAASITGMPCQSGCTITIPGMPGRVVYYEVISRDSSGRAVGQQSGAQAVP